jgi:hypothetical protein
MRIRVQGVATLTATHHIKICMQAAADIGHQLNKQKGAATAYVKVVSLDMMQQLS